MPYLSFKKRDSTYLVMIATIGVLGYLNYTGWPAPPSAKDLSLLSSRTIPAIACPTTSYALDAFDPRFNISQNDLSTAVSEAATIWEEAIGRDLFVEAPNGMLKINLVYDSRQEAMNELKKIEGGLKEDQSLYSALKARYDGQQANYLLAKSQLDILVQQYNTRSAVYEKEVAYWNAQGGAPREKFQELERERKSLAEMANNIKIKTASLNKLVDALNATATELNRVAKDLNLTVDEYNGVALENGQEFTEGDYKEEGFSRSINIYEFSTRAQLIRVLAHEFGHALGLDHTDNKDDIMYRINQSTNDKPTANDIAQIKERCGVK